MVEKWKKATYEMVARVIRASTLDKEMKEYTMYEFADKFADDNPRFDRQRFHAAVWEGRLTRPSMTEGGQWSRRDYVMVAETISNLSKLNYSEKDQIAVLFADEFARDNPRFDRERFIRAASITSTEPVRPRVGRRIRGRRRGPGRGWHRQPRRHGRAARKGWTRRRRRGR